MAKPSVLNPLGYVINRQYDDSVVIKNSLFKERLGRARNLYRKDLLAHYGCVNAIEFSEEGELLVSGGDDRRVLLWSVPEAIHEKGSPVVMQKTHLSNIFCLGFDSTNSKIFSGGNDDQVIIHDARTCHLVIILPHRKPVYGLSINPQNDYILGTAGDDGRILIFDIREPFNAEPLCLAKQKTGFHSVMFNPSNPRWLITANSEEGIALWDYRKPKEHLIHYDAGAGQVSGISACFNSSGSHILALRRRLPPVLYATENPNAICQFYHPQYYNSCTMKTCCFAGDNDEYVLSGSDDFNLYMWSIPNDNSEWGPSHVVLKGHRSIVNQVRYNKNNNLIASSGVEKMVKLWSTLPVGNWSGSLLKEHIEVPRPVFSHDDYIYLVGNSGERISHDYSDHSTQEDSKMMAFFDSLIQREIEGWDSPSDNNTNTTDSESDENESTFQCMINSRKCDEVNRKLKPNRIVQLIAQKRNRLAKMARGKSSSFIKRNTTKDKNRKRKTHKFKSSKCNRNNSTPCKKLLNKRNVPTQRSLSRENRKSKITGPEKTPQFRKYRTRQSIKEMCGDSTSNNSFDIPSTSTGITGSNNSVFRVIEQDSDDDILPNNCSENHNSVENNFVNILPTPLNGTHDMYINVLEMTNGNTNVLTLRNEEYEHGSNSNGASHSYLAHPNEESYCYEEPSTSNNGTKCTYVPHNCKEDALDEDCASSSNSRFRHSRILAANFVNEYITNSYNINNCANDSESDSDYEYDYHTPPIKKRRSASSVTDSGCSSGPCSSNRNMRIHQACSSRSTNGICNDRSSEEETHFKKRVTKARLNLGKQMFGDSDSN